MMSQYNSGQNYGEKKDFEKRMWARKRLESGAIHTALSENGILKIVEQEKMPEIIEEDGRRADIPEVVLQAIIVEYEDVEAAYVNIRARIVVSDGTWAAQAFLHPTTQAKIG